MSRSIKELPLGKDIKILCSMQFTETDGTLLITAQDIEPISSVKVEIM